MKIRFLTDNNEITLESTSKTTPSGKVASEIMYKFVYTKSKTKKGMALFLKQSELDNLIQNNIVKIL
jgi:hypothetical protein